MSCPRSCSITQTQTVVTFPLYRETESRGNKTRGNTGKGQGSGFWLLLCMGEMEAGGEAGALSSEKQLEPLVLMSSGSSA